MVCDITRKIEIKIIALACILISIAWIVLCGFLFYHWDWFQLLLELSIKYRNRNEETIYLKIGLSLVLTTTIFITSVLLLFGKLVPWLVCIPIGIGLDISLVIYEAYSIFTDNQKINFAMVLLSLCFWSLVIFLQCYFWGIVFLEHQALKKVRKEQQVRELIRHHVMSEESILPRYGSRTNISVANSIHGRSISTMSLNQYWILIKVLEKRHLYCIPFYCVVWI